METNNSLYLTAPWAEVRERIKEANIELTNDDLQYTPGKDEELLQRLGKKLDMTPENVKAWIESISANKGKAS